MNNHHNQDFPLQANRTQMKLSCLNSGGHIRSSLRSTYLCAKMPRKAAKCGGEVLGVSCNVIRTTGGRKFGRDHATFIPSPSDLTSDKHRKPLQDKTIRTCLERKSTYRTLPPGI